MNSDFAMLAIYALTLQTAAMVIPGPNMVLLAGAATSGFRSILATAFGFATAGAVISAGSIVLIRVPWLQQSGYFTFALLGILCGCYLMYVAVDLLRSDSNRFKLNSLKTIPPLSHVRTAISANLANPKTLAFFIAVFGGAATSQRVSIFSLAAVVALIFVNSIVVHSSIGQLFAIALRRRTVHEIPAYGRHLAAAVFMAFAIYSIAAGSRNLLSGL